MLGARLLILAVPVHFSLAATLRFLTQPGPVQQLVETGSVTDSYDHPSWLGGCSSIFLDVGSNIGVQVRKVFEPEKYPAAKLLPAFAKFLGSPEVRRRPADISGLCALGFEPNPAHRERLDRLAVSYAQRGWRTHFYPFAAWDEEGFMALNTTAKRESPGDTSGLGVHLEFSGRNDALASVRTVNLADFIRSLPTGSVRLMKMDVEGAEWETLAELLKQDVLCDGVVQSAFIETHPWGETTHWGNRSAFKAHPRSFPAVQERMRQLSSSGRCPNGVAKLSVLDDETYPHDVDDDFRGSDGAALTSRVEPSEGETVAALPAGGTRPPPLQTAAALDKKTEVHVDTADFMVRGGKIIRIDA